MASRSAPLAVLPLLVATLACGTKAEDGVTDGGSATSSGTGSTTDAAGPTDATSASTSGGPPPTGSSSTSGGSTSETDAGGSTSGSFVEQPDGGGNNECDPREQDCPDGEKCTAWADDGESVWNANKCVPQTGTNQPGDPCTLEGGGVSGLDDCAKGAICLFGNEDGMGICLGFCEGSDETCPTGDPCIVANNGTLPLCLDACNPLLQDCPNSEGCYDSPDGFFVCFADASGAGGLDGDPCPPADGENLCDPGLWCGPGSSGCVGVNCCTPYCDLSGPSCTAPDECVSFYGDPGNAPPGLEDVGVCVVP